MFCSTLNSWIGEFVVSFFDVTNMLVVQFYRIDGLFWGTSFVQKAESPIKLKNSNKNLYVDLIKYNLYFQLFQLFFQDEILYQETRRLVGAKMQKTLWLGCFWWICKFIDFDFWYPYVTMGTSFFCRMRYCIKKPEDWLVQKCKILFMVNTFLRFLEWISWNLMIW